MKKKIENTRMDYGASHNHFFVSEYLSDVLARSQKQKTWHSFCDRNFEIILKEDLAAHARAHTSALCDSGYSTYAATVEPYEVSNF